MRSQLDRQVNGRRAISTADDTDGSCFLDIKAKHHCTSQRNEYAELCSSAHEDRGRIRNQRTEVGHCAYA